MLTAEQYLVFVHLLATRLILTDATRFCDYLDPCTNAITNLPYPERRTDNCDYKQDQKCDDLISSTWYKTEALMLDYCPQKSSCGALYPIWLDGTEPSVSEGAVERTACLVGSTCCDRSYSIKIKNCTSFQAYCLPSTTGCPERYCFGQNGSCLDPTTTSTTLSSTQSVEQDTPVAQNCKEYYVNHVHCVSPVILVVMSIASLVIGGGVMFGIWRCSMRRKVTNDDGTKDTKEEEKGKMKLTNVYGSKCIKVQEPPPEYREKAN